MILNNVFDQFAATLNQEITQSYNGFILDFSLTNLSTTIIVLTILLIITVQVFSKFFSLLPTKEIYDRLNSITSKRQKKIKNDNKKNK